MERVKDMFLYQKLKYDYSHIDVSQRSQAIKEISDFIKRAMVEKPDYVCFDTETTGLNIITDKPFLMSIGYNKCVRTLDFDEAMVKLIWKLLEASKLNVNPNYIGLGAHNCKFDYHMNINGGAKIPENIKVFDSITIARLTEYADEKESMSLESMGQKYVDDDAKFAGKVIKEIIKKINSRRRNDLRQKIMDSFPNDDYYVVTKKGTKKGTAKLTDLVTDYEKKRVAFVNDDLPIYKFIEQNFTPANYHDVYLEEPNLMRSYAADDIVIMLEWLKKAVPAVRNTDPGLKVIQREGALIPVVAEYERVGLKVDVPYILESRKKLLKYRDLLYFELEMYTGQSFTAGQHDLIKRILFTMYGVKTDKCDDKALKYIKNNGKGEVVDVVTNIIELRTIDKWLSTYVDGKLNAIINGRIHTDINLNGAVSGRVSCDMQQQPKDPLVDRDENELFHPRKMFVPDEGYKMFFID
jgi:DNA polymerase I-like protein with 3'-5' exonuclease and polymerase domains